MEQSQRKQQFFRRRDAAEYISKNYGFPCSVAWLAKLATVGGGPVFRKAGRFPIYSSDDLDLWAKSKVSSPYRATGIPISITESEHESSVS